MLYLALCLWRDAIALPVYSCTVSCPHTSASAHSASLGPVKSGRPHHSVAGPFVPCEVAQRNSKLVQHLISEHFFNLVE